MILTFLYYAVSWRKCPHFSTNPGVYFGLMTLSLSLSLSLFLPNLTPFFSPLKKHAFVFICLCKHHEWYKQQRSQETLGEMLLSPITSGPRGSLIACHSHWAMEPARLPLPVWSSCRLLLIWILLCFPLPLLSHSRQNENLLSNCDASVPKF